MCKYSRFFHYYSWNVENAKEAAFPFLFVHSRRWKAISLNCNFLKSLFIASSHLHRLSDILKIILYFDSKLLFYEAIAQWIFSPSVLTKIRIVLTIRELFHSIFRYRMKYRNRKMWKYWIWKFLFYCILNSIEMLSNSYKLFFTTGIHKICISLITTR